MAKELAGWQGNFEWNGDGLDDAPYTKWILQRSIEASEDGLTEHWQVAAEIYYTPEIEIPLGASGNVIMSVNEDVIYSGYASIQQWTLSVTVDAITVATVVFEGIGQLTEPEIDK